MAFSSVRPTIGKMIINLDTTMTAIYQRGNLVQLAMDFLDRGNQNPRQALNLQPRTPDYVKLEQFLKNVKILVHTTGRTKVIRGLESNADGFVFTNRDGDQVTVGQYMEKAYNLRLQFHNIIGVRLTGPRADHPEIVPLELCEVKPGQLYKKKLPQGLTESAQSFATMKPNERMSHIEGQKSPIPEFIYSEYVVQAEMKISQVPIEIQGKILQPPSIRFAYPRELSPHAGSWNVVGGKLFQPSKLHTWAVVWFVDLSVDSVKRYIKGLQQSCADLGMFSQGRMVDPVAYQAGHGNNPEKALQQALTEVSEKAQAAGLGPQILQHLIILVILPPSAEEVYAPNVYELTS
uniref:Uncharacterized protein n=1 Tax=Moniliophthora roreri TaxID=221103 RepID=A0A0W0FZP2_MONRR